MIYNSFNFILLYPLIFLLYYVIPAKYPKARNFFLLAVSYLLYINWKPAYALILLSVTLITYLTAIWIEKAKNATPIKVMGITLAILPLLFFKYFNFINENIRDLMALVGLDIPMVGLNLAIPIGISFFTFQSVGYVLDVNGKRVEAEHDFLTYALFLSFFPSILMGPINKASLVIPQLKSIRPYFDQAKAVEGLKMIMWGMFMKVVVADRVALYVNTVVPNYMNYSGATCLLACFLYNIQIYADFAGYSLMALGVGKTLGFELTENFKRPCFAYSVSNFWGRWHISLSTWLKEHVYFTLGGSRCSKPKIYRNLILTFMVSGIWHGANWTFITWGLLHGICLAVERATNENKLHYGTLGKTIKIFITFNLITLTRVFFQSPTLTDAFKMLGKMCDFTQPFTIYNHGFTATAFIIFGVTILMVKDYFDEFFPEKMRLFNNKRRVVRWSAYVVTMTTIMLAGVFGADQFIYANF